MDNKIIYWKEEFVKLFPESTNRELKPNHKWCDKCNGIGFIRKDKYIQFCTECQGKGQIELCFDECGREKYSYYIYCKECKNKHDTDKQLKKDEELFEKAEKIKFADYEGYLFIGERVVDKDEFSDDLYDKIKDNEDYPTYVYGTTKEQVFSLNFEEIVYNACEDGYEDMNDNLNYDGVEVIQYLIDKWVEKQGDASYCYWESNSVVVLLDDLIEDIIKELERGK